MTWQHEMFGVRFLNIMLVLSDVYNLCSYKLLEVFCMRYGVRRYRVQYSLRGNPRATGFAVINAPSMQYIRDNWYAICGGQAYVLRKIVAV